jgi:hypothetical protein
MIILQKIKMQKIKNRERYLYGKKLKMMDRRETIGRKTSHAVAILRRNSRSRQVERWITTTRGRRRSLITAPSLSLSFAGATSGTPANAGSSTFTVQMMDAAQQYDMKTLPLTVQ